MPKKSKAKKKSNRFAQILRLLDLQKILQGRRGKRMEKIQKKIKNLGHSAGIRTLYRDLEVLSAVGLLHSKPDPNGCGRLYRIR